MTPNPNHSSANADLYLQRSNPEDLPAYHVVTVSGDSAAALRSSLHKFLLYLNMNQEALPVADIAYTTTTQLSDAAFCISHVGVKLGFC